jgi:branched-chain amino acid transport system permease protein
MKPWEIAAFLAVTVGLLLFPSVGGHAAYLLHILVLSGLYAIPAMGLNLMLGYTGLVSLGQAAVAGVGAYAAAILAVDAGLGFWLALPVAVAASAATGAAIGVLCLRLRTHFFMIVTLAFGLILHSLMNNWDALTGGAAGLAGVPRPEPIVLGPVVLGFRTLPEFYRLTVVAAAAVFALQLLLVRSQFGRVLAALRQDEILAAFKGINPTAYKLAIFAIGSGLAGLGGALEVSYLRVAAPSSFDMVESINLVLIVVVGGAGYLVGPLLGALLFVGAPEYLRMASQYRLVIFGALLVLVTLFARRGLAGLLARRRAKVAA